jgi:catechol 2,3-dioxygenase-like lactoylglutathione lyase family enzyme
MALLKLSEWSFGATIPAKDLQGTRRFYEDVLGAEVLGEDPGGVFYRTGDTMFSVYASEFAGTAQHTLGSFVVDDVEKAMVDLRGKGVTFEDYDLPDLKTENGIADFGDGMKGAWFKDPEGNILAIVNMPPA